MNTLRCPVRAGAMQCTRAANHAPLACDFLTLALDLDARAPWPTPPSPLDERSLAAAQRGHALLWDGATLGEMAVEASADEDEEPCPDTEPNHGGAS